MANDSKANNSNIVLLSTQEQNGTGKPLFDNHLLNPVSFQPEEKFSGNTDWILGVLISVFLILAWVRVNHSKRLRQIIKAFQSNHYVNLIIRENDSLMQRASIALNAVYILVAPIFIYQLGLYYGWTFIPTSQDGGFIYFFLIVSGSILLVYSIKTIFLWIIGFVFKDREKFTEYLFNTFLINKILGMALLPIVICLAFIPQTELVLIKIGIFLFVSTYVYRLIRGLIIGSSNTNFSMFYLFLYLCTLEILPTIVFIKIFIINIPIL